VKKNIKGRIAEHLGDYSSITEGPMQRRLSETEIIQLLTENPGADNARVYIRDKIEKKDFCLELGLYDHHQKKIFVFHFSMNEPMGETEYRCFLSYASEKRLPGIPIQEDNFQEVLDRLKERLPEFCFGGRRDYENFWWLLWHLEGVKRRGSMQELFFKAGLFYLAMHLEEIDLNLIGTTPSEIAGLPLRLLSKVDREQALELIRTEEKREALKLLWQTEPSIFNMAPAWTKNQKRLLLEYLDDRPELIGLSSIELAAMFSSLDISSFGEEQPEFLYEEYITYSHQIRCLRELEGIRFPGSGPLRSLRLLKTKFFYRFSEMADIAFKVFIEDRGFTTETELYLREQANRLNYMEGEWFIRVALSPMQIFSEACTQNNCLCSYISEIEAGKTLILFLRKTEKPTQSLVTIEIRSENKITEVFGKNNEMIEDAKLWQWLRKYAKRKELYFEL